MLYPYITYKPAVLGYLRRYHRWNGRPGLALSEQRALVRQVARAFSAGWERWRWFTEEAAGVEEGWPVLREVIDKIMDDQDLGHMLVIPTLDGVQFNTSFLGLLTRRHCEGSAICVNSGWRKLRGVLAKGTDYQYPAEHPFWAFVRKEEWEDFCEIVGRVYERNRILPGGIRLGLKRAATCGVRLGGRRSGAYRFTQAEQKEGGRKTAERRRKAANASYRHLIPAMLQWRATGLSIGQIAMKLADNGATTEHGDRIGPMLVHRILKRAMAESR